MDTSIAPEPAAPLADFVVETNAPDPVPSVTPEAAASDDAALEDSARASVPDNDAPDEATTSALNAKKRSLEGRKQTYQQQINDLARQRGELQRTIEAEQRQHAAWRQQVQARAPEAEAAPPARVPVTDPYAPTEDQFETYGQYVQATSAYHAQRAVAQATQQAQVQAREQGRQRYEAHVDSTHMQRVQTYAASNPAFADMVNREDIQLSVPMIDVIKQSEMGPQLMEYLARHTDEAEQLAREGNPLVAYGRMKVLEERVSVAGRSVSATPQRSQAPPPITPVGSAPSSGAHDPSDLAFGTEYVSRMNALDRQRRRWR